jgi:ribulose-5-phosphate 4-epimerase/fuculose-1-phosphate aldolase
MTTVDDSVRAGGREVWSPSITPGIGVELSLRQQLACSFRVLAHSGFSENIAGHITWAPTDDGTMWVNPWGLWWEEVTASDLCRVDADGQVLEGKWDVTPAIHIHTELHRRRPDARVVVHNHPYHVTVLAGAGILPELVHQTGSMFDDDLHLVQEYSGEIDTPDLAIELAEQIGDYSTTILASHGVIVTASTIEEATYKAASIDRVCRLAYDLLAIGRDPLPIGRGLKIGMKKSLIERGSEVFWNGAVRSLLRTDPEVLD